VSNCRFRGGIILQPARKVRARQEFTADEGRGEKKRNGLTLMGDKTRDGPSALKPAGGIDNT